MIVFTIARLLMGVKPDAQKANSLVHFFPKGMERLRSLWLVLAIAPKKSKLLQMTSYLCRS